MKRTAVIVLIAGLCFNCAGGPANNKSAPGENWQNYLTGNELAALKDDRYSDMKMQIENNAQKRSEAAARYRGIVTIIFVQFEGSRLGKVHIEDIPRISDRRNKDEALAMLDIHIKDNWLTYRIDEAKRNYHHPPLTGYGWGESYSNEFANTPFTGDAAAIKKLADLGITGNINSSNSVLQIALVQLITGDAGNSRFLPADQIPAKLDGIANDLLYTQLLHVAHRIGREPEKAAERDYRHWESQFENELRSTGLNPQEYFIRLGEMGLGWGAVTRILILCRNAPSLYRTVLTWDQPAVMLANDSIIRDDWETLKNNLADENAWRRTEEDAGHRVGENRT